MTEKLIRSRDIFGVERARQEFHAVFNGLPAGPEKQQNFVEEILRKMGRSVLVDKKEELRAALEEVTKQTFENDEDFFETILETTLDFVDKTIDPMQLEKILRTRFLERGQFEPLSEILSFGVYDKAVHIHLAPAKTMGPKAALASVKAGLEVLAKKMVEEPRLRGIEKVTATSWIVAKNPRLLEVLGFIMDEPISDEMRRRHFSEETRPVASCYINREDFLKKYLK